MPIHCDISTSKYRCFGLLGYLVFGQSDRVQYSLVQRIAIMLESHIVNEAVANLCTWYARVLTESDVADFPLRT